MSCTCIASSVAMHGGLWTNVAVRVYDTHVNEACISRRRAGRNERPLTFYSDCAERVRVLCLFHTADTDKTKPSCPCRRCELNWRQDETFWSCLDPVSNLQLFSLKYIEGYWNCLDLWPILFTPPTRTRQDCLVLSLSAVWNRHYVGWVERTYSW